MKITYGNVQPNSKESKIWLDDKGLLRTYNSKQLKWSTDTTSSDTNVPEVDDNDTPKTITFFVYDGMTGDTLEYRAKENMTWGEFIETEYNTHQFFTLEYHGEIIIAVTQTWGSMYRVLSNDQQAITSTLTIVPGYTYTVTDFMV